MFATTRNSEDPFQRLFNAVIREDFSEVERLLNVGVSIECKAPGGGKQVLHVACEYAIKEESVKKLIALGANVNAKTSRGFTPLHIAAQQGLAETAIALIKAGAELEVLIDGGMGTTPLQEAAYHGRVQLVRILIAAGASPVYRERKYQLSAIKLAAINSTAVAMPIKEIENALLGASAAFKKHVLEKIEKWMLSYVAKNRSETEYLTRLTQIPHADLCADEYFLRLSSALDEGYDSIKDSMRPLRSSIIQDMKRYNGDKKAEQELKAIFSAPAACGAGASTSALSR